MSYGPSWRAEWAFMLGCKSGFESRKKMVVALPIVEI